MNFKALSVSLSLVSALGAAFSAHADEPIPSHDALVQLRNGEGLKSLLEENVHALEQIAIAQLQPLAVFDPQTPATVHFNFDSMICLGTGDLDGTCTVSGDLNYPNSSARFIVTATKLLENETSESTIEDRVISVRIADIEE